jgi:tRNA 2-thiouridine synthesizing protein C
MTPRRFLFVVSHAPHRGALATELLDELLVGAVFEQRVSVLFTDDGVFQLIDNGQAQANAARGYRALPTYDITNVFVDQAALKQRGLSVESLAIPVRALTRGDIRKLVADQDVVVPD